MLLSLWVKLHGGFWRYRERLLRSKHPIVRRIRFFLYTQYLESRGSYIARSAVFAGEPKFPHGPTGVFIAPGARIGRDCVIYQQVTIGVSGDATHAAPNIGDNVFIGSGGKLIGAIEVGDNVRIGANAVVVKDVPNGTTVVPSPARYIC